MNSAVTIVLSKNCNSFNFDEIWNSRQIEGPEFNGDKIFYDSWRLPILTPVDIGTYLLGHSFGPKPANFPILMKFGTLHNPGVVHSIVAVAFLDSWRLSILTPAGIDIGTCHLLGQSFWPKIANAPVLLKFCTSHKTRVVNSVILILSDASGYCRELKLGIEKKIFYQKCYCYIINKTGKKIWLTSVKLFSTQLLF